MGRPTTFKEDYIRQAEVACKRTGATDEDLAALFDVDVQTIYDWKNKYELFAQAIKRGKFEYDTDGVEKALLKRAKGMKLKTQRVTAKGHVVDVEETLPPDPTSMIFWLKNRRREYWKDRQDLEHAGEVKVKPVLEFIFSK